jgi:hypothetical protein
MASSINASTAGSGGVITTADNSGVLNIQTAGTTAITVDASQNVGIGTSSPASPLNVKQNGTGAGNGLRINAQADDSSFNIYSTGTTWNLLAGYSSTGSYQPVTFYTGGSERMRITSAGLLGLGLTNPNCLLDLYSSSSSSSYQTVNVYNTAATSTTKNNNRLFRLASSGNGADACFQVTDSVANNYFFGGNNGGAYVVANSGGVRLTNTATSWTSDSDERLKNITGTYSNALSDIAKIQPIKFTWKSDELNTPQVGVTAQSVQLVVPEAVSATTMIDGDDTQYLGVRYTELIPLMIAAIQELNAKVDAQAAEIATLKGAA